MLNEIEHRYGPQVHILSDVFMLTELSALCQKQTVQPEVNGLVSRLYAQLIRVAVNAEFPHRHTEVETRMVTESPLGVWAGKIVDKATRAVVVNVIRAGTLPSQVCYEHLNYVLEPQIVRQDHVVMSRMTDQEGHVIGTHLGASKIGGDVQNAIVLFPDPMGATGGSLSKVLSYYKSSVSGKAQKYISLNLIVTPEFIRKLQAEHPDLTIYALRLDRAASSEEALKQTPGTLWSEESGLTDKQYIVPGAGGLGEIMNNSFC